MQLRDFEMSVKREEELLEVVEKQETKIMGMLNDYFND
jgi:hypothetical protein